MHTIIRSQRRRILVLLALVAVFASGCIRVNLDIEVREDGSGEVSGIVALNAAALEEVFSDFGDLGEDLDGAGFSQEELCNDPDLTGGLDASGMGTAEPYNEDGFCGTRFSETFGPGEFDATASGLAGEGGELTRNGDTWTFRLPFDESEFDTTGAEGFPGLDDVFDDAEYVIRVKLPGRQVEHNGDFIDDQGFVVWDIDVTNPPAEMFLITEPGDTIIGNQSSAGLVGGGGDDGGGFLKTLLIVLAVLAVLGLGAWFLISRNKAASPAVATGVGDFAQPGAAGAPPAGGPSWNPGASAAPPAAPGAQPSWSAPASPAAPVAPTPDAAGGDATQIIASPTPEQAMTPTWDPVRRTYVQWDATNNRWLVFDDATQAWAPEA